MLLERLEPASQGPFLTRVSVFVRHAGSVLVETTNIGEASRLFMGFALCAPNLPWATATSAGVQSLDAEFGERTLPVEHRNWGTYLIQRSQYPQGLILIPIGSDPTGSPAVLPVSVTDASELNATLDPATLMDFHNGGGIVFV